MVILLTVVKNIKAKRERSIVLKFMIICLAVVENIGAKIKRKHSFESCLCVFSFGLQKI